LFNGIIENTGTVRAIRASGKGSKLVIDGGSIATKFREGDSIAVDGVCLTVARRNGQELSFDVSPETLARTNLGKMQEGIRVNLEPPLLASSGISGHFVQGHVEGVGRVRKWVRDKEDVRLTVSVPARLVEYCVEKGSIAINGVSLTIAALKSTAVEVALIPYTLEKTNLGDLQVGDRVNIETDIVGRYVVSAIKKAYHRLKSE
jgi:riboflavin synthase